MITYRTMPEIRALAAIERLIQERISEAARRDAHRRDQALRYAVALSNRNAAPVQLYLEDGAGRVELYRIPACCQAHREAVFSADPDFPRDCSPEAA